jgi:23S rRNA pseudouridine955/2504/2580 synthase
MAGTLSKRFEIIYEDESCIAINKPAGLAVQGGEGGGGSLDGILARAWGQRPLLVHRLDKDTSGVILVAQTKQTAAGFSALFSGGRGTRTAHSDSPLPTPHSPLPIKKHYLAICKGRPAVTEGTITLDLDIRGSVKKSKTHFKVLETFSAGEDEFSLLELEPGTGRMHQIRRHLAVTGNPVLGDDKYGDFGLNRRLRKTLKISKLMLHSSRLIVPETHFCNRLDLNAPLPEHFQKCVEILRG